MLFRLSTSITFLSILCTASATTPLTNAHPQPSPDMTCSDARISTVLRDCRLGGFAGTAASLKECVCSGLGIELASCTLNCQSSSVIRESPPSTYSTGMTDGNALNRNFDGEPHLPAMITVPPTRANQMHHAAGVGGKAGIDISGRLQNRKQHGQPKSRNPQKRKNKKGKNGAQQKSQGGMSSTARKILGGIAVGVLVLVI